MGLAWYIKHLDQTHKKSDDEPISVYPDLSEMPRASSDHYPVSSDSHALGGSQHKHHWLLCVHGPFRSPDHLWGHKKAGWKESGFSIIRVS